VTVIDGSPGAMSELDDWISHPEPGLATSSMYGLGFARVEYHEHHGDSSTLKIEVDNSGCDGIKDKSIEVCGSAEIAILFRMLDLVRGKKK
jgi:hypothetical protein